jgi:hypothetical protein
VLLRLGYTTVRFSGDQIRADVQSCAREFLALCGVDPIESEDRGVNMNSPRYLLAHVTDRLFRKAANRDMDPTFCTETGPLGFGCLVSAEATRHIGDYYYTDPRFSIRTHTVPRFELASPSDRRHKNWNRLPEDGLHYLSYSHDGKRKVVYLTAEEHSIVRLYTKAFDAYNKGHKDRELYLQDLETLPKLDLKLFAHPDTDYVYSDTVKRTKSRGRTDQKRSPAPVRKTFAPSTAASPSRFPSPSYSCGVSDVPTVVPLVPGQTAEERKRATNAAFSGRRRKDGTLRNRQARDLAEWLQDTKRQSLYTDE